MSRGPNFLCLPNFFSWIEFVRFIVRQSGYPCDMGYAAELWYICLENILRDSTFVFSEANPIFVEHIASMLVKQVGEHLEEAEYERVTNVLALIESSGRIPVSPADSEIHDSSVGTTDDIGVESG